MAEKRNRLLDSIRQSSAKLYARRAASSFKSPEGSSALTEAERRETYEQGWLDCASVLLGLVPTPPNPKSRPNQPS